MGFALWSLLSAPYLRHSIGLGCAPRGSLSALRCVCPGSLLIHGSRRCWLIPVLSASHANNVPLVAGFAHRCGFWACFLSHISSYTTCFPFLLVPALCFFPSSLHLRCSHDCMVPSSLWLVLLLTLLNGFGDDFPHHVRNLRH